MRGKHPHAVPAARRAVLAISMQVYEQAENGDSHEHPLRTSLKRGWEGQNMSPAAFHVASPGDLVGKDVGTIEKV